MLSPSATALRGVVDASEIAIPDIVVSVPSGFNESGSSAALQPKVVPLNNPVVAGVNVLPEDFGARVPVVTSLEACLARSGDGVRSLCEGDPVPRARATINGDDADPNNDVRVAIVQGQALDETADASSWPTCVGSEGCLAPLGNGLPFAQDVHVGWSIGCRPTTLVDLCSGQQVTGGSPAPAELAATYMNVWTYLPVSGGSVVFHQDRFEAGTDRCANGRAGQRTSYPVRAVARSVAPSEASTRTGGLFRRRSDGLAVNQVSVGATTAASSASNEDSGPVSDQSTATYTVSAGVAPRPLGPGKGWYLVRHGERWDSIRGVQTTTSAASGIWEAVQSATTTAALETLDVQLLKGTAYQQTGSPGSYTIKVALEVQWILDLSDCE